MMQTPALLIRPGWGISRIDLGQGDAAHYEAIRAGVGNTITTAFELPGEHPDRPLVAYCDDEFLLHAPDWNFAVDDSVYPGGYAYGGPVVLTGGTEDGATRGMTDRELNGIRLTTEPVLVLFGQALLPLPLLLYDRMEG